MKNKLTILTILALLYSLALTSAMTQNKQSRWTGAWKGSYTVSYLKQDHVNEFNNTYYYERIDNTSFILKYTGQKTIYTVKVTYTQDKPFSVKETAKILSEESINADDFKETHEGIRLPI